MASRILTFIPKEGIVKNFTPYGQFESGGFNQLINARLTPDGAQIEQTPHFTSNTTWTAGTYYSGGSLTEPSNIPASLLLTVSGKDLQFSQYTARVGGTQVQVFRQTTVPAAVTINTNCMVEIINPTALALTLGQSLDIVIDGATTFKWRKNGGGFTTLIPITTSGVSIDSGNAIVYFLIATGFTVNDTWSTTRTDYLTDPTSSSVNVYNWSYAIHSAANTQYKVYFVDYSSRVMVYDSTYNCVRSVGYRPVYGTCIALYYKHLFVGAYSLAAPTTFGNVVGNSDLGDLDNFFSTDINEADTYLLSPSTVPNRSLQTNFVMALSVINGILFAYTISRIWATNYDGLPTPFSFQEFRTVNISYYSRNVIKTQDGDYFLSDDGPSIFDGNTVTLIAGNKLAEITMADNLSYFTWGGYDARRKETYFFFNSTTITGVKGFWVYQERTQTWYFRAADFTISPRAMQSYQLWNYLSVPLGVVFDETTGAVATLINDFGSGASLQLPLIELFDCVFPNIQQVVESEAAYLDTYYSAPIGSAYGTTGVTLETDTRVYPATTPSYPTALKFTWTTSSVDGTLPVRASGRLWTFRIRPTVAAGKASFGFVFNALMLNMTGLPDKNVTR